MERKIGREIREFQQLLHRLIESERPDHAVNLTHIQVNVLVFISKHDGPVFQKDIEKVLNVRRSTVTEILNVLERDDLIIRQRCKDDARQKRIVLTPKSMSHMEVMQEHIHSIEERLRLNISDEELTSFFDVLDRIKENMR